MSDLVSNSGLNDRLHAVPEPVEKLGKSERTRAEIQDAAFAFLWSRPFREMSVNSLMSNTHSSRSAFYQYFKDVHELVESLLGTLENEILEGAQPWFVRTGDPVALLDKSLGELVSICYRRGPFLKAVSDAAPTHSRLEAAWSTFLDNFDHAVAERIRLDQEQGLIAAFDPQAVATTLNRMDAYTMIHAFGERPRKRPEPVRDAITRVWIGTLYGNEWLDDHQSNLTRT